MVADKDGENEDRQLVDKRDGAARAGRRRRGRNQLLGEKLKIDTSDEIIKATLLTENGAVVNPVLAAPVAAEAQATAG